MELISPTMDLYFNHERCMLMPSLHSMSTGGKPAEYGGIWGGVLGVDGGASASSASPSGSLRGPSESIRNDNSLQSQPRDLE